MQHKHQCVQDLVTSSCNTQVNIDVLRQGSLSTRHLSFFACHIKKMLQSKVMQSSMHQSTSLVEKSEDDVLQFISYYLDRNLL